MTHGLMIILSLGMLGSVSAANSQEGPRQSFEVTSTEHAGFAPGGTIRLQGSYGFLTVEGWDEPEVEVVVTRSTDGFYQPRQKPEAIVRLHRVKVSTENSAKELTITTDPVRKKLLIVSWPFPKKRGVTAEYIVHVPRESRLEIQHDNGYVWVSDVTGDIQVHSHTGDMMVLLPDPGAYAIDAQTRMGSVSSDFTGHGRKLLPAGAHFSYTSQAPARHVNLRMGRGSIEILSGPPAGPFWKN